MFWPLAANSSCVAASRTCPMLPGADWNLQREHRLDRIDDDERRLEARDLLEDALETGLGQDVERRALDAEPLAARLDLVLRLFARAVEHRPERLREVRGCLEQQRRLADARLAADEHQRPRDDAAAEHAVELADAGRQPLGDERVDVRVQLRPRGRPPGCTASRCRPSRRPVPALPAPRRASSTRRTRRIGRATSATARRIPGRRRRSWFSSALS